MMPNTTPTTALKPNAMAADDVVTTVCQPANLASSIAAAVPVARPIIPPIRHSVVDSINGVKIKTLADVPKAFAKDVTHHRVDLLNGSRPVIIEAAKVEDARKRILERYQVHLESRLDGKEVK